MTTATICIKSTEKCDLQVADFFLPAITETISVISGEMQSSPAITVSSSKPCYAALRVTDNAIVRFAHLVLSTVKLIKVFLNNWGKRISHRTTFRSHVFMTKAVFLRI